MRYASAAALADDLERWQNGEPIQARSIGRVGRVLLWAKRNPGIAVIRGLVGMGVLIPSLLSGLPGIVEFALAVSIVWAVLQARLKPALLALVLTAAAVMLIFSEPSTGISVVGPWVESWDTDQADAEYGRIVEWFNRVELLVWMPVMIAHSAGLLARQRSKSALLSVLLLCGLSFLGWVVAPEWVEGRVADDVKLKWFLIVPLGGLFLGVICRIARSLFGGHPVDLACGGILGLFVYTWIGGIVAALVTPSIDAFPMLIIAFLFIPLGTFAGAALAAIASNRAVKREQLRSM